MTAGGRTSRRRGAPPVTGSSSGISGRVVVWPSLSGLLLGVVLSDVVPDLGCRTLPVVRAGLVVTLGPCVGGPLQAELTFPPSSLAALLLRCWHIFTVYRYTSHLDTYLTSTDDGQAARSSSAVQSSPNPDASADGDVVLAND